MRGHFGMLTQALLSPPSLVSPPALTFIIRLRRHTLVLPRRPQRSRPGAVSGAAAVCATPNTHMTTPGGIFCWPRWKGDTTSGLLSLLSTVDGDVTSQLPASATTPATCDGLSSLWNQKPKSTLLSVALAMCSIKQQKSDQCRPQALVPSYKTDRTALSAITTEGDAEVAEEKQGPAGN